MDPIEIGTVIEKLPNMECRIELSNGKIIMAYISGKMRKFKIRCEIGDKVEVVMDPYGGKNTNRVIRRK